MAVDLATTTNVILTLMIFSILFKNTIIFRLGVAIWLGSSVGYSVQQSLRDIWERSVQPLSTGEILQIVPLVLGIMLFFRLYRKHAYLARIPSAFTLGIGTGAAVAGLAIAQIYKQALSTATITNLDTAISAIWLILIILYFILTLEHKGPLRYITSAGRWLLMITFGLGFGSYATGRFTTLISRFQYILYTWLGL